MNFLKPIFGKRLLKTAIAVFLTASICEWLDWPAIFAVIAAIVTIEPTVSSSIRKGKIRLPAAAVGAAFAMLFEFLWGPAPLTYTLSAFFTIFICHRLGWGDAIVVATLTAVNMITLPGESFFIQFLIRLGTTSTGIIVSTLVNFFVFPPNFMKEIEKSYQTVKSELVQLLQHGLKYQLDKIGNRQELEKDLRNLLKGIDKSLRLIDFQKQEYRYHRRKTKDLKKLSRLEQKVQIIQKSAYHAADLLSIYDFSDIRQDDKDILWRAFHTVENEIKNFGSQKNKDQSNPAIHELFTMLFREAPYDDEPHMSKSSLVAYELLAVHTLISKRHVPLHKSPEIHEIDNQPAD
jgi:uncharacterized membrane protein YgaE (UPF0421/DUF939 family)